MRYPSTFLREVDFGTFGDGNLALYGGLLEPRELLGDPGNGLTGIVLFGDDFAGTLFCFDLRQPDGVLSVESGGAGLLKESDTFQDFITDYLNDLVPD